MQQGDEEEDGLQLDDQIWLVVRAQKMTVPVTVTVMVIVTVAEAEQLMSPQLDYFWVPTKQSYICC